MKKWDFETYQKRFQDFEILSKFSETHFSRYHSPPLMQFSIVAIHSSKFGSVNHYLREKKKNSNDLGQAWQNIAETIAFANKRKSIFAIQIQEALKRIN